MKITDQIEKSKESKQYSRLRPYEATLLEVRSLSKKGSTKENLHVVLDLSDSEITYKVGSSFGIYPQNPPELVKEILILLELEKDHIVYDKRSEGSLTIEAFLRKKVNLQKISSNHLKIVEKLNPSDLLTSILSSKDNLLAYTAKSDLISFLSDFWSPAIDIQLLCDVLPPLLPRYYSVASAQKMKNNKLELMVASFSYKHAGRIQESTTAGYLKHRCKINVSKVALFLMENNNFQLPEDRTTPVILIGPGTGLAALRGFLQERFVQDEKLGNNWLFTGDRNRKFDFHYEEELVAWEKSGFLKLSLAFSRDAKQKCYVQDELKKNSSQIWDWLNQGAHLYICGDAKNMAKDVTLELQNIAMREGQLSEEDAKIFFKSLKKEKRFCLDVY